MLLKSGFIVIGVSWVSVSGLLVMITVQLRVVWFLVYAILTSCLNDLVVGDLCLLDDFGLVGSGFGI
jgi:hypothetical protein